MAKGRSAELIKLRNKKLIERYFYWSEIKRRRFDDVLTILSTEEFFLSEATIERLIRDNDGLLQKLFDRSDKKVFQTKLF